MENVCNKNNYSNRIIYIKDILAKFSRNLYKEYINNNTII